MSEAFADTGRFDAGAMPFAAGFASRHDGIGDALRRAFSPPAAFAPTAPGFPAPRPAEKPEGPRHFHPADRDVNPTEGWDPFDPEPAPVATPDLGALIASARAEGYAEGLRVAREEAQVAAQRERELFDKLATALSQAAWLDRERFATQLRQTVMSLVTTLVGENGVSADHLAGRVDAATELLADTAESALLRLNPADLPLVEGRLPKTVFPIGDATIARGAFSLEAASTIVEDGPERWLAQLADVIDRVPLPTC